MREAFGEELKHNLRKTWFGYIRCFSHNCFFVFKHLGKGQRKIRCKSCGVKVPKEVPRIFISGSWYYWTGHYCLKCAEAKIREEIVDKEELSSKLQDNLVDLRTLLEVVSKARNKNAYLDIMSIHILNQKLEGDLDE